MKKKLTMNDVFTRWMDGNGFFNYLMNNDTPWKNEVNAAELDMLYHGYHSGDKLISPIIERFYIDTSETVPVSRKQDIANSIYSMFIHNWSTLWLVNVAEYNPISNYDMTEVSTDTKQGNTSDTSVNTNNTQINASNTSSQDNNVFGFNTTADDGVDDSKTDASTTASSTQVSNMNGQNNGQYSDTTSHTLTRSGNIGVTTSQQMAESSYELAKRNYFKQVFEDIDSILTLSVY